METFAMVTTIAVALITAVFGPIVVNWTRNAKETDQPREVPVCSNKIVV